jgi:hypothetical protein
MFMRGTFFVPTLILVIRYLKVIKRDYVKNSFDYPDLFGIYIIARAACLPEHLPFRQILRVYSIICCWAFHFTSKKLGSARGQAFRVLSKVIYP